MTIEEMDKEIKANLDNATKALIIANTSLQLALDNIRSRPHLTLIKGGKSEREAF